MPPCCLNNAAFTGLFCFLLQLKMRSQSFGTLQSIRAFQRISLVSICLALLLFWSLFNLPISTRTLIFDSGSETASPHLPCWSLPGANETLVVLRTGATEIQDRFPVHTSTTLRCLPRYLIFSDVEEDFAREHVHDALESVSPDIKPTTATLNSIEDYSKVAGRSSILTSLVALMLRLPAAPGSSKIRDGSSTSGSSCQCLTGHCTNIRI